MWRAPLARPAIVRIRPATSPTVSRNEPSEGIAPGRGINPLILAIDFGKTTLN
jgi:hypothetical protein